MISPFANISAREKKNLLSLLKVHIYNFDVNYDILGVIKNDDVIGIIDEGAAEIRHINYNGEVYITELLEEDSIFSTTISSINNDEFEMITTDKTTIIVIDYSNLINQEHLTKSYYNTFIQNLFTIINEKTKEKNERIRILTKKTIRNKLLEYFKITQSNNHSKNIYLPFNYKDLADYLAIDRCAMARELKYMKEEGFIEIKGKRITLLYWKRFLAMLLCL